MAEPIRETKTERVQLLMSQAELEAIDEWGWTNRIRTRAEAIRRLCRIALASVESMPSARPSSPKAEGGTPIVPNLRRLMAARGITARPLAKKAGLNETAVYDIMSGKVRSPRHDTLAKLAKALSVSVSEITGEQHV
jgi:DNA-binding Xre family transcriptional regulator